MTFWKEAEREAEAAAERFGPMASAHEGFAVLSEEVDELWVWVKTQQAKRDRNAMRRECIQIAAVARRIAELCETGDVNGR